MIPIFTSLPPRISRVCSDGHDIGPAYLEMCIKSWRDSGFAPFTVNASSEDIGDLPEQLGVSRLTTDRDSREITGKPLIYIKDFIEVVARVARGPVAIVNADILLDVPSKTQARLAQITPGEFAVFSRTEIKEVEDRHGHVHDLGIDLFVFHSDDLHRLDADRFILGVPWWDHFIPVAARLKGLRPIATEGVGVYHLLHEETWNEAQWLQYGEAFWKATLARAEVSEIPERSAYLRALSEASQFSIADPLRACHAVLRSITAGGRKRNFRRGLVRISRANMKFIGLADG